MKRCHLLTCACPEVGVVILVWEQGVRFEATAKARQMTRVSQTEDRRYIVTAFSLLFAPLGSSVLEPDLLKTNKRVSKLLGGIVERHKYDTMIYNGHVMEELVLTFKSVAETIVCDHSTESY